MKKWIALAVIVVLMLGLWEFDVLYAKSYSVELLSMSPSPGIADGQTPVTVRLQVKKGDTLCSGHILYGVPLNGGSFNAKRVETDEQGIAEFIYYPYLKSKLNQLTDVTMNFRDESNSVFIAVPAKLQVVLKMVAPAEGTGSSSTNDSMFG